MALQAAHDTQFADRADLFAGRIPHCVTARSSPVRALPCRDDSLASRETLEDRQAWAEGRLLDPRPEAEPRAP